MIFCLDGGLRSECAALGTGEVCEADILASLAHVTTIERRVDSIHSVGDLDE